MIRYGYTALVVFAVLAAVVSAEDASRKDESSNKGGQQSRSCLRPAMRAVRSRILRNLGGVDSFDARNAMVST